MVLVTSAILVAAVPAIAQGVDRLDSELRERAGGDGHSRVIVRLSDGTQEVTTVANGDLDALTSDPRILGVSTDRVISGSLSRTTATIGSYDFVNTYGLDGAGIGVAVIDSGAGAHEDLDGRVVRFVDFTGETAVDMPAYDDWGHGTHVAGIISGSGAASSGANQGVAPGAHIVALKALDASGQGYVSDFIEAIDWAIANRSQYNIRVINISASAGVFESYTTDPLTLAAKRAVDAGIVVVAAAGNLGRNPDTGERIWGAVGAPGNAPWVLTVGASSVEGTAERGDDVVADFSSRGPTRYDLLAKPDVVGPGVGVVSAMAVGSTLYTEQAAWLVGGTARSPYMSLSGTSMATPVVSGTVALMLQINPELTPNLVKAILQYTSQVYEGWHYLEQGAGFLDASGAVTQAYHMATSQPGDPYLTGDTWSRQVIWGNVLVTGGAITPGANAWEIGVTWGQSLIDGEHATWGVSCDHDATCRSVRWGFGTEWSRPFDQLRAWHDRTILWSGFVAGRLVWATFDPWANIIWGSYDDAGNIVWGGYDDTGNVVWGGSYGDDNIVWGNYDDAGNIVWGSYDDAGNIVWGNYWDDNIVWGGALNVVWGTYYDENIVWGSYEDENIVWGNYYDDNIVWGSYWDENIVWGNYDDDNLVWGNYYDENLVWGSYDDDNIVWGSYEDNIVWGNYWDDNIVWGGLANGGIVW